MIFSYSQGVECVFLRLQNCSVEETGTTEAGCSEGAVKGSILVGQVRDIAIHERRGGG